MEKDILEIEIDAVKIIGKIKGTDEKIEMLMDKDIFNEWRNKQK